MSILILYQLNLKKRERLFYLSLHAHNYFG